MYFGIVIELTVNDFNKRSIGINKASLFLYFFTSSLLHSITRTHDLSVLAPHSTDWTNGVLLYFLLEHTTLALLAPHFTD